jgi:hypothetical protein
MKTVPFLALVVSLFLAVAAPAFAGGKSSAKHARARAAKAAADKAAEEKAEARAAAKKAGVELEEEDGWTWKHRRVRHKQTMPAAPTPREERDK